MRLQASIVSAAVTIGLSSSFVIHADQGKPAASVSNPISQAIRDTWESAKRNMNESAAQMPEADYGFRPTEQVRTFGEIIAHVAGASYVYCSAARGEKSPHEEDDFEKTAKTKARATRDFSPPESSCSLRIALPAGVTSISTPWPRAGCAISTWWGAGAPPRPSSPPRSCVSWAISTTPK